MLDVVIDIFLELYEEAVNFITFKYAWWLYVLLFFTLLMYFSVRREYRNFESQKNQSSQKQGSTTEENEK
jgi:glucan phosphoethanolaminetransferase (alkaline phosphatase superfamily)